MIELGTLILGLAALAATAWCPPRLTRGLGAVLFGVVVGIVLRFSIGGVGGAVGGLVAIGLAFRFLPLLVLRRGGFFVAAPVVLVFSPPALVDKAPPDPLSHQRPP